MKDLCRLANKSGQGVSIEGGLGQVYQDWPGAVAHCGEAPRAAEERADAGPLAAIGARRGGGQQNRHGPEWSSRAMDPLRRDNPFMARKPARSEEALDRARRSDIDLMAR